MEKLELSQELIELLLVCKLGLGPIRKLFNFGGILIALFVLLVILLVITCSIALHVHILAELVIHVLELRVLNKWLLGCKTTALICLVVVRHQFTAFLNFIY